MARTIRRGPANSGGQKPSTWAKTKVRMRRVIRRAAERELDCPMTWEGLMARKFQATLGNHRGTTPNWCYDIPKPWHIFSR